MVEENGDARGEVEGVQLILPATGVWTQVATAMTPTGVETAMLLSISFGMGDGVGEATFAVSTAGVPVLKKAIEEWERGLRAYLAGELEPVVIQTEGA